MRPDKPEHTFTRLRYAKDGGLPAFYTPDFLVHTDSAIYLVETKAQQQTVRPNVQRKLKAAMAWCERINGLSAEQRGGLPWHYVLLAEDMLLKWQCKSARLTELLDCARFGTCCIDGKINYAVPAFFVAITPAA